MPLLPARRLVAVVALAGLAFLVSSTFALLVNATLLVFILADAVVLLRTPLPVVTRTTPPRAPLGGTAAVDIELDSAAPRPLRVQWTDDAGPGITRAGAVVLDVLIPPRRSVRQTYVIRGSERGPTHIGDVHVRVLGPLQLLWRQARVRATTPLLVQPGMRELQRHRALALHHRYDPGTRRVRQIGEGSEFERLREYVRGDDPRRIDWKATARRAQTIVREYEAERSQSIMVAVDAGRLMGERFDGMERLDHALAAALVLADAATTHGDAVGTMIFADTVQSFLPPARTPLSRVADVLARAQTRPAESDYPAAFRHLAQRLRRRTLIVLFTDVIDTRASAALLQHFGATALRHLPLIVALRNVELEHAAAAPVRSEADAFHRAAAEELLQARAVALNAVRRRGVLIADVRPEAATSETLARYLDIKRRGLL